MATLYQRISDDSLNAVAALIGTKPFAIESPTFKIWNGPLHAFSLSMKLGSRDYCVFRNDPYDSGGPLEHYGLSAMRSDQVYGVKELEIGGTLGLEDHSQLWFSAKAEIVSISLRERCFSFDEGDVYVDSSFVFFREDSSRFAISASEQLICSVEFTEEPSAVEQILAQSQERLLFA